MRSLCHRSLLQNDLIHTFTINEEIGFRSYAIQRIIVIILAHKFISGLIDLGIIRVSILDENPFLVCQRAFKHKVSAHGHGQGRENELDTGSLRYYD